MQSWKARPFALCIALLDWTSQAMFRRFTKPRRHFNARKMSCALNWCGSWRTLLQSNFAYQADESSMKRNQNPAPNWAVKRTPTQAMPTGKLLITVFKKLVIRLLSHASKRWNLGNFTEPCSIFWYQTPNVRSWALLECCIMVMLISLYFNRYVF